MIFGVPYRGSKNKIVPWVLHHLPAAEAFVDLFAGGCAVTHGAMLSGQPIYVSEYTMPEDFVPIASRYKSRPAASAVLAGYASEKIFLHEKWAKR